MNAKSQIFFAISFFTVFWAAGNFWTPGLFQENQLQDYELVKKITVPGNLAWTDTALEVLKGQEFYFAAAGKISLQKDNPVAGCGPEGLNLKTQQQPIPDQNIGALLGKVLEKVEVATDKQTGEKSKRDIGQVFYIGKENKVLLPADGRLILGINELVVGDNDGSYEVAIYRKK
jgi:hypothetical protein